MKRADARLGEEYLSRAAQRRENVRLDLESILNPLSTCNQKGFQRKRGNDGQVICDYDGTEYDLQRRV